MARPKKIVSEPAQTKDGIQFFGEVDLTNDNRIRSQLPAWYFDRHIEELEEGINRKKRAIKNRTVKEDQFMRLENEIKSEEDRLDEIKRSKPKLSGVQQDRCASAYKQLTEQIRDSMPTRKQSRDGLVSPHKELQRMKGKHIQVDADIAAACGVNISGGKISGDEAARCYKILGKMLGEETNVESLRRDGNSEAYQSMNDLTRAILQGVKTGN